MFGIVFLILIIFAILTFWYKQVVCEFRINQIEWNQRNANIRELLTEKVPIVLRGIPTISLWTCEDVMMRSCYANIKIFEDKTLSDWIAVSDNTAICPWKRTHAEQLGNVNGLSTWAEKWLNQEIMRGSFSRFWYKPVYSCWAGDMGLQKTLAQWTCIFVSEGSIQVSLLTQEMAYALPSPWKGCFPMNLTNHDTPFAGELKVLDIIVRPGNCLLVPAHWFMAWQSCKEEKTCPMVCMISYHTPMSRLATAISKHATI